MHLFKSVAHFVIGLSIFFVNLYLYILVQVPCQTFVLPIYSITSCLFLKIFLNLFPDVKKCVMYGSTLWSSKTRQNLPIVRQVRIVLTFGDGESAGDCEGAISVVLVIFYISSHGHMLFRNSSSSIFKICALYVVSH